MHAHQFSPHIDQDIHILKVDELLIFAGIIVRLHMDGHFDVQLTQLIFKKLILVPVTKFKLLYL